MWSFRFESWAGLLPDVAGRPVLEFMELAAAARDETELQDEALGEEARKAARVLYHLLVQLVGGRALALVRRTPRGNGLLAWKRLKREFEDDGGHRAVALLMGLLHPSWPPGLSARQFAETLDEWETDVELYEKQTGETLPGPIRVAIVMRNAPLEVQSALRVQLPAFRDDYGSLRSAVVLLSRGLAEYTARGAVKNDSNAMDVDSSGVNLVKGKGKGGKSGKSKSGKSKGDKGSKGAPGRGKGLEADRFQGKCHHCGKVGHKRADCWARSGGKAGSSTHAVLTSPPPQTAGSSAAAPPQATHSLAAAVAAETAHEENNLGEDLRSWVFAARAGEGSEVPSNILFDSGSDEHLCSSTFAPQAPTRMTNNPVVMRDAQGRTIEHELQRRVRLEMAGAAGEKVRGQADFEIARVSGAILSAGRLVNKGYRAVQCSTAAGPT